MAATAELISSSTESLSLSILSDMLQVGTWNYSPGGNEPAQRVRSNYLLPKQDPPVLIFFYATGETEHGDPAKGIIFEDGMTVSLEREDSQLKRIVISCLGSERKSQLLEAKRQLISTHPHGIFHAKSILRSTSALHVETEVTPWLNFLRPENIHDIIGVFTR